MPIYEYSCGRCGETIEAIQKMSDPDLKKHEGCGGALTRLLSVPAFQVSDNSLSPAERNHPSAAQQAENDRKAKEKKKAPSIISAPSASKPAKSSSKPKAKS